jgi:cytochrome P450
MDIDGAMRDTLWREPPVQAVMGRWPERDVTLGGMLIRAGDMLVLGLAAANTDPAVAEGAEKSSYTAYNKSHMSWGGGAHECPAQSLAEVITRAAVDVLWSRLPDIHLSDPDQDPDRGPSIIVAARRSLPASFDPRRPRAQRSPAAPADGDTSWP